MKLNSHIIFLIAIVGIITVGVVAGTILTNGSMKQVDFDGIKVKVPSSSEFVKTADGYADAKYGITVHTFKNNDSLVNYMKGITGAQVIALKNQPPQSLAFTQGDDTNVVVTNGGEAICIGAKDKPLVTDMSNSVIFSNHQKSVKPKVAVPGVVEPPHLDIDVDFNFIKLYLAQINTAEFNVALFENNINPVINDYNTNIDNGTLNVYTAPEFGKENVTSDSAVVNNNQQQNTSLLDNPQANNVVSKLSSDNSGNAAGGDAAQSSSSGGAPVISTDGPSSSSAPSSSGSSPSPSSNGGNTSNQLQKLSVDDIQKFAKAKFPGKTIDKKDIKDKGDYYTVIVKDNSGSSQKVKFDAHDGKYLGKVSS